MKTITTWSALEILGPAYTWPTEVYFFGDFDGRKLTDALPGSEYIHTHCGFGYRFSPSHSQLFHTVATDR